MRPTRQFDCDAAKSCAVQLLQTIKTYEATAHGIRHSPVARQPVWLRVHQIGNGWRRRPFVYRVGILAWSVPVGAEASARNMTFSTLPVRLPPNAVEGAAA